MDDYPLSPGSAKEGERVLVTGGAGYIGSHTCKALAAAGFIPICYDSLELGHAHAVRWGPLEEGELSDTSRLLAVIKDHRPASVIHFAAYSLVGPSLSTPLDYYRNNVGGAISLLEAMEENGVKRLVFSSSCAVYGNPIEERLGEDRPCTPITPYGRSKLMIEQMLADQARSHGLHYATLRYFNAAGADPAGELGEEHQPETHLIPLAIAAALGGPPLTLFGSDYKTPDGTAIRDYIHVSDLAEAHLRALELLGGEGGGHVLNLGTGQGHSVLEVIRMVEEISGRKVPFTSAPRRPGDPPRLVADPRHGQNLLNWRPSRSSLREIIHTAWNWHLSLNSS